MSAPLRIALTGIRGVPARYSGLETCAEEVGRRLAAKGHDITVYCRRHSYPEIDPKRPEPWLGMRRILLPSIKTKHLDTYSHTLFALLHAALHRPDALLVFNPGNATLCVVPRLLGIPVALNPDGFDWKRQKWNRLVQAFIERSAWFSTKVADQLVTDAVAVCGHYNAAFGCTPPALYLPNGAEIETPESSPVPATEAEVILAQYGIESGKYILFLSRHEPENSCEEILRAFAAVPTPPGFKLLFGGGVTYPSPYAEKLKQLAARDSRVVFPGSVYDPIAVKALHHHAYFLINGNQPGGTSLGLLKALGYGTCVAAVSTPDNDYALKGGAGVSWALEGSALCDVIVRLLRRPEEVAAFRRRAVERIREEYLWNDIAEKYERVLLRIAGKTREEEWQ